MRVCFVPFSYNSSIILNHEARSEITIQVKMMLYEAIHLETNRDRLSDANIKIRGERKTVTKNSSAANLTKIFKNQQDFPRTRSFAVVHKLRESKWFSHEETKVLCAVLETGFIIEKKTDDETKCFGIVVWTPGYEKSKDPDHVKVYTLKEFKGNLHVQLMTLLEFWPDGTTIRINNNSDKTDTPHSEEVIRNQIKFAESSKRKWHNSEHFTYWCRYGPVEARAKHASDSIKGINFGLHAGFAIVRKLKRSTTCK